MTSSLTVLIIEDNPDDAELLVLELEQNGYQVIWQRVDTAAALQTALDQTTWDVVLADYAMPGFNAMAALKVIKERGLDLPFLVVSGSIGEETAVELMKAGAHDYLLKHKLMRLVPVVERELREAQVRSQHRQVVSTVEMLAFYDPLTQLPNRNLFLNWLQSQIQKANHEHQFAVLFLDLNQHRHIRYGFGHQQSDQLLVAVAQRLQAHFPDDTDLARVGVDEFALTLKNLDTVAEAVAVASQIHQLMAAPFELPDTMIYVSLAIGIADSSLQWTEPEEYLRAADTANFVAKQQGLVGEKPDGLVGIVKSPATPELQEMVRVVNEGRLLSYKQIADKRDIPLKEVQKLAGANLIEKTPPGQFILTPEGEWLKKAGPRAPPVEVEIE